MLGIGLYSACSAARYLGLPAAKVRRWAEGKRAVMGAETDELQEHRIISFLGLVELMAVKRLRAAGVSLGGIRELAAQGEGPHPLAHHQFHAEDERLEFEGEWPCRYWPLGREGRVRLDPQVSFGKPIVAHGVPAYVLSVMALHSGETAEAIAEWYDVPLPDVEAAVEFERSLK